MILLQVLIQSAENNREEQRCSLSITDGKPSHNEVKSLAHSHGGNLGLNSILNTNSTDPYF